MVVRTDWIGLWPDLGHRGFGMEAQRTGSTHMMFEDDRSIVVIDALL